MIVTLDVRPILAAGGEPFEVIMATANNLAPGDVLELTAPFEPVPLYAVLGGQGFVHETTRNGPAEFVVRFSRPSASLHD